MLIGVIGENCSGKSTLAGVIGAALGAEVATGRDYLRLATSEGAARAMFKEKLDAAVDGRHLVYVISEPEQAALLPESAVRILVRADLDTIKARFRARLRGSLPEPAARMLERKHGRFDGIRCDYIYDGVNGDPAALCAALKGRIR